MFKWLKKKLGILSLQTRVANLEKDSTRIYRAIGRIENKARINKRPMRYDEIERDRKNRKKESKAKGRIRYENNIIEPKLPEIPR